MKIRNGFISNSSSEAFILKTRRNLKRIEGELSELLDLYNRMASSTSILEFEQVFQPPKLGDSSDLKRLKDYDSNLAVNPIGKTVIYSIGDNTIPWGIIEFIESVYEADRIHLG